MKVFKFGGASVKSTEAVRNVANILRQQNHDKVMVIVSAMDKTTFALEDLLSAYESNSPKLEEKYNNIYDFHWSIINELDLVSNKQAVYRLKSEFDKLKSLINPNNIADSDFYATVVGFGEIFSTLIIYYYLKKVGFNCQWENAGDYIITDEKYCEGNVDWELSMQNIIRQLEPQFRQCNIIVSQGFISKTRLGKNSTLGKEGSDYSASIFAFGLNADELTIWKDVPGLLNADPKYFKDTQMLTRISYRETIELAYYGASIIHPKTIQPLQNKNIPLFIKSFKKPEDEGSIVHSKTYADFLIPSYIFKKEQVLLSVSARDFSFIAEKNISYILTLMSDYGLKFNLMQNSAISFSICMDHKGKLMMDFISELQKSFNVKYNEQMELITIRHYNQKIIDDLIGNRVVFLEQKNRTTVQLLVR